MSPAAADLSRPLVLGPAVEIAPVGDFPADVRERLGGSDSDFILSERGSRLRSQRIDAGTAAFLRRFARPNRLVNAVAAHASAFGAEPHALLDDAYRLVTSLHAHGLLVEPDARAAAGGGAASCPALPGVEVLGAVRSLSDTRIWRVVLDGGTPAALKHVADRASDVVRAALEHEWVVLSALHAVDPGCAPAPLLADLDRRDPYVVIEWREGRRLNVVAADPSVPLAERARMSCAVAAAYARLHDAGVLHGDVQPNNVLLDRDGTATVLDFGGATLLPSRPAPNRVGYLPHAEPELAAAHLAERPPPPVSGTGEQYGVAVLCWLLLTGHPYLPLALETGASLRQIVRDEPRAFADVGVAWPSAERVLRRALSKEPAARYPSFGDFARALERAAGRSRPRHLERPAGPGRAGDARPRGPRAHAALAARAAARLDERYGLRARQTRTGLERGPTASIYYGAAGIAYALLRVGVLRDAPHAIAAADVWVERALRERVRPEAFVGSEIGLTSGTTGPASLLNAAPGVHVAAALLRYAMGDLRGCGESVTAFVAAAAPLADVRAGERFALDAANGAGGLLTAAAVLVPVCRMGARPLLAELEAFGGAVAGLVAAELAAATGPDAPSPNRLLGFAHGRAGCLHALLRWSEATAAPLPPVVEPALDELASCARPSGTGCAWPIERATPDSPRWSGWCHGSAGHVLLWSLAARVCGRDELRGLAAAAGEHVWSTRDASSPGLCCGLAGEALALFELARSSGDAVWIDRGRDLARRAMAAPGDFSAPHSLFRGEVGVLLAAIEAADPEAAVWPMLRSPL